MQKEDFKGKATKRASLQALPITTPPAPSIRLPSSSSTVPSPLCAVFSRPDSSHPTMQYPLTHWMQMCQMMCPPSMVGASLNIFLHGSSLSFQVKLTEWDLESDGVLSNHDPSCTTLCVT